MFPQFPQFSAIITAIFPHFQIFVPARGRNVSTVFSLCLQKDLPPNPPCLAGHQLTGFSGDHFPGEGMKPWPDATRMRGWTATRPPQISPHGPAGAPNKPYATKSKSFFFSLYFFWWPGPPPPLPCFCCWCPGAQAGEAARRGGGGTQRSSCLTSATLPSPASTSHTRWWAAALSLSRCKSWPSR